MELASNARSQRGVLVALMAGLTIVMNLWCYPLMVVWTCIGIVLFPVAYVVGCFGLQMPADRTMRWIIWLYGRGWLLLMSPFVRFRRENMTHLSRGKPCLFVVNHLSFFDTYCMALLPVYDITFAVRSWPFRMFWYRQFMLLARYLDVESNSWDQVSCDSQKAFKQGGAVLFFPEGHRSRDGRLQRFYSGGFKVAIDAGVPVIPLCIQGTDQLLPPGRKGLRPCRVTLRALDAVDSRSFSGDSGHVQLRKLVKQRMAEALEEMRADDGTIKG